MGMFDEIFKAIQNNPGSFAQAGLGGFNAYQQNQANEEANRKNRRNVGRANAINAFGGNAIAQREAPELSGVGKFGQVAQGGLQAFQGAQAMNQQRDLRDQQLESSQAAGELSQFNLDTRAGTQAANALGVSPSNVPVGQPPEGLSEAGVRAFKAQQSVLAKEQTDLQLEIAEAKRQAVREEIKDKQTSDEITAKEKERKEDLAFQTRAENRDIDKVERDQFISNRDAALAREKHDRQVKIDTYDQELDDRIQEFNLDKQEADAGKQLVANFPEIKRVSSVIRSHAKVVALAKDLIMKGPNGEWVKNPDSKTGGAGQFAALNVFQSAFVDEQAVVRKEDIDIYREAQSVWDKAALRIDNLEAGDVLSPILLSQMKEAADTFRDVYARGIVETARIKVANLPGVHDDPVRMNRILHLVVGDILPEVEQEDMRVAILAEIAERKRIKGERNPILNAIGNGTITGLPFNQPTFPKFNTPQSNMPYNPSNMAPALPDSFQGDPRMGTKMGAIDVPPYLANNPEFGRILEELIASGIDSTEAMRKAIAAMSDPITRYN